MLQRLSPSGPIIALEDTVRVSVEGFIGAGETVTLIVPLNILGGIRLTDVVVCWATNTQAPEVLPSVSYESATAVKLTLANIGPNPVVYENTDINFKVLR